jgi:hypothetical protein
VELVARAHGGSAGARNRRRGGADVWLSLPRSRSYAEPSEPVERDGATLSSDLT